MLRFRFRFRVTGCTDTRSPCGPWWSGDEEADRYRPAQNGAAHRRSPYKRLRNGTNNITPAKRMQVVIMKPI